MFQYFILYFHNCSNVKLGPTGRCCQQWNNLSVRMMVAKIRLRLTTNIIFTIVVVSLLTITYHFCDSSYIIIYMQPRSATDGYPFLQGTVKMHYFIVGTAVYWN